MRLSERHDPRGQSSCPYAVDLHKPSVYPELLIVSILSTQPSFRSLEATLIPLTMAHDTIANMSAICTAYHIMPQRVQSRYWPGNCCYMQTPPKEGSPSLLSILFYDCITCLKNILDINSCL